MQLIVIKTVLGIIIIATLIVATYIIGLVTRRITEAKAAPSREWETTMIAGLIGWMMIGAIACLLGAAALLGEVVVRAFQ